MRDSAGCSASVQYRRFHLLNHRAMRGAMANTSQIGRTTNRAILSTAKLSVSTKLTSPMNAPPAMTTRNTGSPNTKNMNRTGSASTNRMSRSGSPIVLSTNAIGISSPSQPSLKTQRIAAMRSNSHLIADHIVVRPLVA